MFDNKGVSDYIFDCPNSKQVNNTKRTETQEKRQEEKNIRDWKSTAKDDDYSCFILKIHTICTLRVMLSVTATHSLVCFISPSSQTIDTQKLYSHRTPHSKRAEEQLSNIVSELYCFLTLSLTAHLTSNICVNVNCAPLHCGSTMNRQQCSITYTQYVIETMFARELACFSKPMYLSE